MSDNDTHSHGSLDVDMRGTSSDLADAFLALIEPHRVHTWEQFGPCVYCVTCKTEDGRSVRLFQGTSPKAAPWDHDIEEPDFEDWLAWNTPTPDDLIDEPCPVCHASGACGYDGEGRALIHSLNTDDAAESAVEEVARG